MEIVGHHANLRMNESYILSSIAGYITSLISVPGNIPIPTVDIYPPPTLSCYTGYTPEELDREMRSLELSVCLNNNHNKYIIIIVQLLLRLHSCKPSSKTHQHIKIR